MKDAYGTKRSFRLITGYVDENPLTELGPKKSVTKSLTLLRGGDRALFPICGVSEVSVTLRWALPSAGEADPLPEAEVQGNTTVFITGAHSGPHAKAAHMVLTTPDAHLVLALGGTHMKLGLEAVETAVGNDVLGPQWSVVKAKALAKAGKRRMAGNTLGARKRVS